jgi:hypothetical protein
MKGVLRTRRGQAALGGAVVVVVVVVLLLLLTGGKGHSNAGAAAGANPPGTTGVGSGSTSASDSGGGATSASANGPTYAVASAEDCLKTAFGDGSVSDFPGAQSSISLYHQATTVVDVEGDGEGIQSSSGTLLFFASPSKAAAALPGLTKRYQDEAVNQPNDGSVVFVAGHLAADAQVSVMGCLQ